MVACAGRERIDEILDPELIAERLVSTYERKGYTREWINQRLQAISARKDLEQRLGRPVITSRNAIQLNHVVTQMVEASAAAVDDQSNQDRSDE